jgi:hypothetical protein
LAKRSKRSLNASKTVGDSAGVLAVRNAARTSASSANTNGSERCRSSSLLNIAARNATSVFTRPARSCLASPTLSSAAANAVASDTMLTTSTRRQIQRGSSVMFSMTVGG